MTVGSASPHPRDARIQASRSPRYKTLQRGNEALEAGATSHCFRQDPKVSAQMSQRNCRTFAFSDFL